MFNGRDCIHCGGWMGHWQRYCQFCGERSLINIGYLNINEDYIQALPRGLPNVGIDPNPTGYNNGFNNLRAGFYQPVGLNPNPTGYNNGFNNLRAGFYQPVGLNPNPTGYNNGFNNLRAGFYQPVELNPNPTGYNNVRAGFYQPVGHLGHHHVVQRPAPYAIAQRPNRIQGCPQCGLLDCPFIRQ